MAGDIQWSGYKAASANVLTTEINSLADGSVTALSAEQDNSTNLDAYADFQLDLASTTISSTSAYYSIFIVPTVDGTNYPDWTSGAIATYHGQYLAGTLLVKNVTTATARSDARGILLPPGKFKVALRNGSGAAAPASGSTLAIRIYTDAYL